MTVIQAANRFTERRWSPASFVKARDSDPLIFAHCGKGMPLSTLPVTAGRALVRIIDALEQAVPATRALVALTWHAARAVTVQYDRQVLSQLDLAEPPVGVEVGVGDDVVHAAFREVSPSELSPGVA